MKVPMSVLEAHRCCDLESSRYALGGVKFETINGRPYAIATDGRHMVIVSWNPQEGEPLEAIVSGGAMATALAAVKRHSSLSMAEVTPDSVTLQISPKGSESITVKAPPVEGRFPKWQNVVPKQTPQHRTVALGAKLVRNLLAVCEAAGVDGGHIAVLFTFPPDDGPVLLTLSTDDVKVCGVIMPIDINNEMPSAPAWLPVADAAPAVEPPKNGKAKRQKVKAIA